MATVEAEFWIDYDSMTTATNRLKASSLQHEVDGNRLVLTPTLQPDVGVHLTISESTNPATPYQNNFDYVMGQLHSPQSNQAYIDQTLAYTIQGVPWVASEFNVFGTGDGAEAG